LLNISCACCCHLRDLHSFPTRRSSDLSKAHIIVEIIEYMANSVVIKTIIKKSTGNISIMSFDSGEGLTEKTSPFDTFVQIIEGKDRKSTRLNSSHVKISYAVFCLKKKK